MQANSDHPFLDPFVSGCYYDHVTIQKTTWLMYGNYSNAGILPDVKKQIKDAFKALKKNLFSAKTFRRSWQVFNLIGGYYAYR